MRFLLPTILGLLATATHVLAEENGPCVKDCTSKNAISSQCNGDETGTALDTCRCTTFSGSVATPLFTCIKSCPVSEQSIFAGSLPEQCRDQLLPGVKPIGATTTSKAGPTPTAPTNGTVPAPTGPSPTASPGAAAGLIAAVPAAVGVALAAALML